MSEDSERIHFDTTSDQDIIGLAGFFLSNGSVSKIIRRVGVFGDTSEAEDDAIASAVDAYCKERAWGPRDPLLLLSVPVALARWVSAGKIPSVGGDEARAFVADRQFSRDVSDSGIFTKTPTVEEALWINRDLWANKTYSGVVSKVKMGPISRKEQNILESIHRKIIRKYGLTNRGLINGILIQRLLATGQIHDLGSPEAIQAIKIHNHMVKVNK